MNPAALKANIKDLPRGADIIVNTDEFTKRALEKVGYEANPLEDGTLDPYVVHAVALTSQTVEALKGFDISKKEAERAKNMYALGLLSWLYSRGAEGTRRFLEKKFASKPEILRANLAAFEAGWSFGETTESLLGPVRDRARRTCPPAPTATSRGNPALAFGLIAASRQAGLPLFLGSYPITPASDILHELSKHKNFGVVTFQAEDEIAGIGAALGAAYGGALGVTTTSGPGVALKSEAIGLAVSLELPLVIVDVQRGGPSTGLPTKTEQSDLLQAMFGRNGESPVPDHRAAVAVRLLRRGDRGRPHRDRVPHPGVPPLRRLPRQRLGALAGARRLDACPRSTRTSPPAPNHVDADGTEDFWPYLRDPETLARPWAVPGTAGLEHRIGGLEKADGSGQHLLRRRQPRPHGAPAPGQGRRHRRDIRPLEVDDPDGDASVLVLGWGSTYGPIGAACEITRRTGRHGRAGPPAPPQPVPVEPRRGAARPTRRSSSPR